MNLYGTASAPKIQVTRTVTRTFAQRGSGVCASTRGSATASSLPRALRAINAYTAELGMGTVDLCYYHAKKRWRGGWRNPSKTEPTALRTQQDARQSPEGGCKSEQPRCTRRSNDGLTTGSRCAKYEVPTTTRRAPAPVGRRGSLPTLKVDNEARLANRTTMIKAIPNRGCACESGE